MPVLPTVWRDSQRKQAAVLRLCKRKVQERRETEELNATLMLYDKSLGAGL